MRSLRALGGVLIWFALSPVHSAEPAGPTKQVNRAEETNTVSGAAAFAQHCAHCHSGSGLDPWYPAMERVAKLRSPQEMIEIVLSGKFRRAGQYQGHTIPIMPAWSRLANEEIASIIEYIQLTWGDDIVTISADDVASYRGRTTNTQNSDGSATDFERAQEIYFDRCVGCHSSTREGAAGASLLPWAMRLAGNEANKAMIHYGSSAGMPGFGVSEALTPNEMQLLAEYLKETVPTPPEFGIDDIRMSRTFKPAPSSAVEPAWSVGDLFVALRHDVGGVLIIDGKHKKVVTEVRTDVAPHDIALSADQRHLYVLSRGGRVEQIDLTTNPPKKIASIRVGFEARSLATGQLGRTGIVATSTFYPGHVVLLHGETLELLNVLDPRPTGASGSKFRLSQIVQSPDRKSLLIASKDEGFIHSIDLTSSKPNLKSTPSNRFLRSGSFDPTGEYFVIPTDDEQLVIYDVDRQTIIDTIFVPGLTGGSRGVFYEDPDAGPVWVASAMADATLTFLNAELPPTPNSWRTLYSMQTPGAGSLYVAGHPASQHLWFDIPLNPDSAIAGALYAVDKAQPRQGYTKVPILDELGDAFTGGRVLHPQFNQAGDELWVTVWNRQDETSAIVIVDDQTKKIRTVIEDPRLITPIRTYALWQYQ